MYQGLLHLHSLLRWIILILLVVNIVRHFTASNNPFTATDKKLGLFQNPERFGAFEKTFGAGAPEAALSLRP